MSKIGRDRKGLRYQTTTKRKVPWKPIKATHEERYEIIRKKSKAGVEHVNYKPIILKKRDAKLAEGPNRAQKRKDKKWEKGQKMRDRRSRIRTANDIDKSVKRDRIAKQHEANRVKSAARRAAKK